MHLCDNPGCVNPRHLSSGSQFDNMRDMTQKGRRATGSKVANRGHLHPQSKLTEAQAREIRTRANAGELGRLLAKEFGISQNIVSKIKLKRSWKYI